MKKQEMVISNLKCQECGNILTVPRKRAKQREDGHIKHMFCPYCKDIKPFEEDKLLQY